MRLASQLANSTTNKGQEHAERALNKLARTFASQIETLKRYRTGENKGQRFNTSQ